MHGDKKYMHMQMKGSSKRYSAGYHSAMIHIYKDVLEGLKPLDLRLKPLDLRLKPLDLRLKPGLPVSKGTVKADSGKGGR